MPPGSLPLKLGPVRRAHNLTVDLVAAVHRKETNLRNGSIQIGRLN